MKNIIFFASILLITMSCLSLKEKHIIYDKEAELLKYHPDTSNKYRYVYLRNVDDKLTDSSNISDFKSSLALNKNKYVSKKQFEKASFYKISDFEIAKLYAEINKDVLNKEYSTALTLIDSILSIYPEIPLYSDIKFIQGYSYYKIDSVDKAKESFEYFFNYSAQKLPNRIREQGLREIRDSSFINQRKFAKLYLVDSLPNMNESDLIKTITPKYVYTSFTPGYTINLNNFNAPDEKVMFIYASGSHDYADNFMIGLHSYIKYKKIDAVVWFGIASEKSSTSGLAIPFQVYKAPDNRFGFKVSPFINNVKMDSIPVSGKNVHIGENIINGGVKLSAGYQIVNSIGVGAYYTYNYYNYNNRYHLKNAPIEVWNWNTYDVSLYYTLMPSLIIKAGITNEDLVGGLFYQGWEISYNFTTPGLIFRSSLY